MKMKTLALLGALSITACGGGGGGDGGSIDDDDRNLPPARPTAGVIGVAFDGLIINGDVRIYDFTGAVKGTLLGETKTDGQGLYAIELSTASKPILIEIDGGYYIEEASGIQVQVDRSKGRKLLAVEYYESGSALDVSATFFSTVATGLVEYIVSQQGLGVDVAIERAYQQVDAWAGFDTRRTIPVDVSDPASATPYITDAHRYGYVAAGISTITKAVGDATDAGLHDTYTSIGFIQTAYDDVKVDGLLDGNGSKGRITFGNVMIDANTYRSELALKILQFVRSGRNYAGLEFNEVLPFASQVNLYTGDLFGTVAAPDIKLSAPTITQFIPANGAVINGSYPATVTVIDQYGAERIDYYVDDVYVDTDDPRNEIREIDTVSLVNGRHKIHVEVTNFMGNKASQTRNIIVNNRELGPIGTADPTLSSPRITQFVPADGTIIRGSYPVSVLVDDEYGIATINYYVDGQYVAAGNPGNSRRDIDTLNFTNGWHTLRVDVTNFMGNRTSLTRNVIVNNGELALSGTGVREFWYDGNHRNFGDFLVMNCPFEFSINDSTGFGIKVAKIGEVVLLVESNAAGGSAPISSSLVPDVIPQRDHETVCQNATITASDRINNNYTFPFRVTKTLDYVDVRMSGIRSKITCRWFANESC